MYVKLKRMSELLECARRGLAIPMQAVVEDGPEAFGVSFAAIMLSRLRRRIERNGARRAVDVAPHRFHDSSWKPRCWRHFATS